MAEEESEYSLEDAVDVLEHLQIRTIRIPKEIQAPSQPRAEGAYPQPEDQPDLIMETTRGMYTRSRITRNFKCGTSDSR